MPRPYEQTGEEKASVILDILTDVQDKEPARSRRLAFEYVIEFLELNIVDFEKMLEDK